LMNEISAEWTAPSLRRQMRRTLTQGDISSFDVDVTTWTRNQPDGAVAHPVLFYRSRAAEDPVRMEAELEFVYDETAERWEVLWSEHSLLPGYAGGARRARFQTEYRWPRRAGIFDRDGRAIARGGIVERAYPFGLIGGTTVGHLEPLARGDVAAEAPHDAGDLVGASGLEAAFEERLAGTPRGVLRVVDGNGDATVLGRIRPTPGRRARVTLDMDVQRAAEAAFGSTVGGAVVLDPSTGDLLAVVSSSPFDPNNYVGVPDVEPFNRALSGLYPPGSSLKVMTAAAALEERVMTPTTQLTGPKEYRGVRNFESGEFGTISFASALRESVNTAFAQVALELGPRRLKTYADGFGFNSPPSMELAAATSSFPFPEDEGDVMWGAIGQAQVLATPLQMATIAATVANGGRRMEPRILTGASEEWIQLLKPETAATLRDLMEGVVESGTGVAAGIGGVSVAGKTGTAEVDVAGERKNHAWFICFAPADTPRVAVAVVVELGGIGGRVAAPIARQILQNVLPLV
ncbi:MAG: peptidoglycan D,D-transpeptidase FtsI family protein, partial [Actinomycetota bacterium]